MVKIMSASDYYGGKYEHYIRGKKEIINKVKRWINRNWEVDGTFGTKINKFEIKKYLNKLREQL